MLNKNIGDVVFHIESMWVSIVPYVLCGSKTSRLVIVNHITHRTRRFHIEEGGLKI
jgi:hypothetical protein